MNKYLKYAISLSLLFVFVYLLFTFNYKNSTTSVESISSNPETSSNKVVTNNTESSTKDLDTSNTKEKKSDVEKDFDTAKVDKNMNDLEAISSSSDNYSIFVSSSYSNALVSLNEDEKEIIIKVINDKDSTPSSYDNYINFTDENINYLSKNFNTLLNDFKSGNLLEKYNLVCDTLKEYDTDLTSGDLVKIAFMYLK